MAQGDPQGWESLGVNDPLLYKANLRLNRETGVGQTKQDIKVVTNRDNGNYDVYSTAFGAGDKKLFGYNASNDKIIVDPNNKAIYDQFFTGPRSQQLTDLNKSVKQATLKLAENNVSGGSNSTSQAALNRLKQTPGYKSIAAAPAVAPDAQGGTPPTSEQSAAAAKEAKSFKKGTRKGKGSYDTNMKYPINLKSEVQDVIRFSILEYSPSLAKENRSESGLGSGKSRVVTLEGNNPIIKGSTRIGMITLPIPAGISDGNPVGWQQGDANALQMAGIGAVDAFFSGSTPEQVGQGLSQGGKAVLESGDLSAAVRGFFVSQLTNQSAMQRTQGAVLNNNAELLFSGPGLRQFSFQFLFYPREPKEAIMVRKIIRAFKQAMSVKRSATSLLLKSPHTFAIQYMTSKDGKAVAHPYLNRFKECALTSCSVDYTPEGTYMTYSSRGNPDGDEKSMTAYRMTLSFSELEPLFDDEYGESDYDNVGF